MKQLKNFCCFRKTTNTPNTAIHQKEIEKEIERKIVSRLSRGNVSLQAGRYITKEEIDIRYERMMKHDFMTPPLHG